MEKMKQKITKPKEISLRHGLVPSDLDVIYDIIDSSRIFTPKEISTAIELAKDGLKKGSSSGYHFVLVEYHGCQVSEDLV